MIKNVDYCDGVFCDVEEGQEVLVVADYRIDPAVVQTHTEAAVRLPEIASNYGDLDKLLSQSETKKGRSL